MGIILWRQNTGCLQDKTGRWIKYGLCVGSSDLIGIYKGRFLAVEVKVPGKRPTSEQLNFIDVVNKAGGIAAWVTSVEEFRNLFLT